MSQYVSVKNLPKLPRYYQWWGQPDTTGRLPIRVRMPVPKELQSQIGKTLLVAGLGTRCPLEAEQRGREIIAQFEAIIADAKLTRQGHSATYHALTIIKQIPNSVAFARSPLDLPIPTDTEDRVSGVYFLFLEKQLQYVGQSWDVFFRVKNHGRKHRNRKRIPFDEWRYIPVEEDDLDLVEAFFRRKFRPPYDEGLAKIRKGRQRLISDQVFEYNGKFIPKVKYDGVLHELGEFNTYDEARDFRETVKAQLAADAHSG